MQQWRFTLHHDSERVVSKEQSDRFDHADWAADGEIGWEMEGSRLSFPCTLEAEHLETAIETAVLRVESIPGLRVLHVEMAPPGRD
ncbi:hypothetical protein ACH4VR_29775 [Streptomyces sp. NPDC020883]|uniref:hypothetical protein n=1 Tax=Streptomyces sp. NPDC020883 TaxID=3365099 RepID=UPI00378D6CE2